jgi:hypothetical protein
VFVSVISPYEPAIETQTHQMLPRLEVAMKEWAAHDTKTRSWEVLLVYDTVSNVRAQTMSELKQKHANLRPVLMNSKLTGHGAAFREGIQRADGDAVAYFYFGEEMTPEDLPFLLDAMERGYDFVHGIRHKAGGKFEAVVRNENMVCKKLLGGYITDYLTGMCAVKKELVIDLELVEDDHLFLADILVHRGLREDELTETVTRFEGAAKKSGLGAFFSGFGETARVRKFTARLKAGYYNKAPGKK